MIRKIMLTSSVNSTTRTVMHRNRDVTAAIAAAPPTANLDMFAVPNKVIMKFA